MQPWKTLSRKTILDYSKFLRVEEHAIELPDGKVIEKWPWDGAGNSAFEGKGG